MGQEDLGARPEPGVPFEVLIDDYRAAFERLARRMTRSAEDAEDLLQETLLDAYRSYPSFRSGTGFYSWVARIMTNNQLDRRRRKHHPVISLDSSEADCVPWELPDLTTNPERALFESEIDPSLVAALGQLQPHHRECVRLVDLEGATYEEAAAQQACPIGTIRSRLHRAHAAMQRFVGALVGNAGRGLEPAGRSSRRELLRFGAIAAASATVVTLTPEDGEAERRAPEHVNVRCVNQPPPDSAFRRALAMHDDGKPVLDLSLFNAARRGAAASQPLETVFINEGDVLTAGEAALLAQRVRTGEAGVVSLGNLEVIGAILGEEVGWSGGRESGTAAVQVLAPRHPLAEGIAPFGFPSNLRAASAFIGPTPSVAVLGGPANDTGERGWGALAWQVGRGRVFYLDSAPDPSLFTQESAARLLRNAARWVAWRT